MKWLAMWATRCRLWPNRRGHPTLETSASSSWSGTPTFDRCRCGRRSNPALSRSSSPCPTPLLSPRRKEPGVLQLSRSQLVRGGSRLGVGREARISFRASLDRPSNRRPDTASVSRRLRPGPSDAGALVRQVLFGAGPSFVAWAGRSHPSAGAARRCLADAGRRCLLGDGARRVRARRSACLSRGGTHAPRYGCGRLRWQISSWCCAGRGAQRPSAPPRGSSATPTRIADPGAWTARLRRVSGYEEPRLEVVQHRLRIADEAPPRPSRTRLSTSRCRSERRWSRSRSTTRAPTGAVDPAAVDEPEPSRRRRVAM
jgi:hypothetical protein